MGWQDGTPVEDNPKWMQGKPVDQGFMARVGGDLEKRYQRSLEGKAAQEAGEQTGLETGLQDALSVGGFITGDVPGQVLQSAWNYTPEAIQKPIKETAQNVLSGIANFRIGDNPTVADIAKGVGAEYSQFEQENPRAGRNVRALADAGNIALAATPIKGKSAIGAASDVVEGAGKQVGNAFEKALLKQAEKKSLASVTSDVLANEARMAYDFADKSGGVIKPHITDNFIAQVQSLSPQTALGKVGTGDSKFTKLVAELDQFKGTPVTLQAAQEFDEALSDVMDGLLDNGRLTKEGRKVLEIQNKFRDSIASATDADIVGGKQGFEALKEGRRLWSKTAKMRDIERIIQRAEMTDNPATSLKAGFRNLAMNPARMRGFTAAERKVIEEAAKSGIVTDTLKVFGSRLIPIGTMVGGGGLGGAAAAQAAAMASRGLATKAQLERAAKVAREIAKDSKFVKPESLPK